MKKLYSACWPDDCFPFNALLDDYKNTDVARTPDDLKDPTAGLVIWGGADINPELYGHPQHRLTYPGGFRDRMEWSLLTRAKEMGMAIIGVCRGAQMLCAAAGGFLLQDVENHHGMHEVVTMDGKSFNVNSIHHQMLAGLEKVDHELVAWRPGRMGAPYGYMDDKWYEPSEDFKEPEFVYFPKIRGYAIQWHPEGMSTSSAATEYILNYISNKEKELDGTSRIVTAEAV